MRGTVFGMDASEERVRIVGQLVVAIAQDFLVARRQIVIAGHDVPIEDSLVDGFASPGRSALRFRAVPLPPSCAWKCCGRSKAGACSFPAGPGPDRPRPPTASRSADGGRVEANCGLVPQLPDGKASAGTRFAPVESSGGGSSSLKSLPRKSSGLFPILDSKVFDQRAIDGFGDEGIARLNPEKHLQIRRGIEDDLLARLAFPERRFRQFLLGDIEAVAGDFQGIARGVPSPAAKFVVRPAILAAFGAEAVIVAMRGLRPGPGQSWLQKLAVTSSGWTRSPRNRGSRKSSGS